MTRVFIADPLPEERSALRLVLQNLHLEVIGEADDWNTALAQAPILHVDMLLIDWSMLPNGADTFLSKGETPERMAERLQSIIASIRPAYA